MVYLASQDRPAETTKVGERLRFAVRLTAEESAQRYVALSPSGSEERVQPDERASSGLMVFQTEPAQETGIHMLVPVGGAPARNQPVQALAVNCTVEESDLARVGDDALDAFWARMGIPASSVRHIVVPDEIPRAVRESRYGVELWRYCVILALLCALIEMVLSRAGTPIVSTETHAHNND
jgi:hypothetical protein